MTVTGNDIVSGTTVSFGSGVTVSSITPVDANHLTAKVQPSASAAAGPRTVTLTNPDGGRGTCAGCFTVDLAPVVSGIDPPAESISR